MNRILIFSLLMASVILQFSCHKPQVKINGTAQGTYYFISYFDAENRNLQPQIDSILEAYNSSVSIYDSLSVISRFNHNEKGVIQDSIFLDNLMISLEVSKATGGYFDPTVGPLVNAWGFGFKNSGRADTLQFDSLMRYIGYNLMEIRDGKAVKKIPQVELSFNAIAQGYSVDIIATYLEEQGISSYIVDIGGEVKTAGVKPGGEKWTVGIEKPAGDKLEGRSVQYILEVEDMAVATSGNYRKYYIKDGVKYSHTIDPLDGKPVSHNLLSATVITDDCARADAYATAFMVMGTKKALDFVKQHPGKNLEVLLIYSGDEGEFNTAMSEGFGKYMAE